jgi:hypothetical protein
MDRQIIEEQHIIPRYLAGQLDAAQTEAFERYYEKNPDTVRDIERVLRLREGLAILEERGELDALVRARSVWKPALALAASIAVLVVGVWLWMAQTVATPLAGAVAALGAEHGRPLRVASTHVFVRTRGASATSDIVLPAERSAIELRVLPSSRPDDRTYRVVLGQLDAANAVAPIAETSAVASAEDGFVTAYLDSSKVGRGHYVIEVLPEHGVGSDTATDRFIIQVR